MYTKVESLVSLERGFLIMEVPSLEVSMQFINAETRGARHTSRLVEN